MFTEDTMDIMGKFLLTNESITVVELFAQEEEKDPSIDHTRNALKIYDYLSKRRVSLKELVFDWHKESSPVIQELNELLSTNTFIEKLVITGRVGNSTFLFFAELTIL